MHFLHHKIEQIYRCCRWNLFVKLKPLNSLFAIDINNLSGVRKKKMD